MADTTQFRSREAQNFRAGLDEPETTQLQTLLRTIVEPNAGCEFGRAHGFSRIASVADYRQAVPIRKYEAFDSAIERIVAGEQGVLTSDPVKRFFLTSGSMAKAKYIPITNTLIRSKSRAFGVYWAEVFAAHPEARSAPMVTNFSDSGAAVKAPGSGLPCSSESAYWAGVTRATSLATTPIIPKAVAQISDSDARYYTIARILLEEQFSVIMTLNPSTILLLFQTLVAQRERLIADVAGGGIADAVACGDEIREWVTKKYPGNPTRAGQLAALGSEFLAHSLWPQLSLAISWRSPMLTPYLELLAPHLQGIPHRDYILMASEGVMAIPLEDGRSGGPVALGVHYYEFLPEEQIDRSDPDVLQPHELEDGRTYVLILSNGSGLYRYNIGDVVRVRGFVGRTPCIEFLHRAGSTCSLTGEKLTEDQVTAAVAEVARTLDLPVVAFTLAPAAEGFPHYVAYVEFEGEVPQASLAGFPGQLDGALHRHNIEYGSKRSSHRLAAPELAVVQAGGYAGRRQQRLASGASDSQIKPTHLTRDSQFGAGLVIAGRFYAD